MATTTRKTKAAPPPPPPPPVPPADLLTDDAGALDPQSRKDVAYVLSELGDAAVTIKLHRKEPNTGKWRYLGPPIYVREFDQEQIRLRFGGGEYQARITDRDSGYLKNAYFDIEGAPRDPTLEAPGPELRAGSPYHSPAFVTRDELRLMLSELRNPPAGAAVADPMAMTSNIMASMTTAIAPLVEQIAKLAGRSQPDPGTQAVEMLRAGLELGADIARERGGGGTDPIERFGIPLLNLLNNMTRNTPAAPAGAAPAPGAPGGAPAWAQLLAPHVPQLADLAARGRDPALYAELTADNMKADDLERVSELTADPGFIDGLLAQFPQLTPHRGWVAEYFSVLGGAEEEEEEEAPAPPALPPSAPAAPPEAARTEVAPPAPAGP